MENEEKVFLQIIGSSGNRITLLKRELKEYIEHNKHEFTKEIGRRAQGNPLKAYESMLEVHDEVIDRIEDDCNIKSCCNKGCVECCYQAIYVNNLEANIILDAIDKLDDYQRELIRNKSLENMIIIQENSISLQLLETDDESLIQNKYLKLNLSCPLLGENNSCMIYKNRPSVCQRYRNYGAPNDCKGQISKDAYAFSELQLEQAAIEQIIGGDSKIDKRFILLSALLVKEL